MPAETVVVVSVIVAAFAFFGALLGWATSIADPAFPGTSRRPASARGRDIGPVAMAH